MNIVIDEKIPYLKDVFTRMGHSVVSMPGDAIDKSSLLDAGALFVRTRTKCNAELLDGTSVRFIGSATIGYDHIDADYCHLAGIEWVSAPGCNADAVLQYVQSAIYAWALKNGVLLQTLVIGIVGVGQIGSRVSNWARSLGMKVLLNDPIRSSKGESGFVSLDDIATECNVITLHPTLSYTGDFPSFHLVDSVFLAKLQKCGLLINASRGPVVDNAALLSFIEKKEDMDIVLDVWENEPYINLSLLEKAFVATPHIAGYSAKGKLNASKAMIDAFARFTGYKGDIPHISLPTPTVHVINAPSVATATLEIYSPLNDTARLKANPDKFEYLRNNYVLRHESSEFDIFINGKQFSM